MGETGTGKSTMINAFANFLKGNQFDAPQRHLVFVEDTAKSQLHSQTKKLGTYFVRDQAGVVWKLVDTPGFGDTDDKFMDQQIVNLVQGHFEEEGAKLVDLQEEFGTDRSLIQEDGLHPSDSGTQIIAASFNDKI